MRFSKLVAYGEAMVRLTTRPGVPLDMADELSAPIGGAELNCAIAARRSGLDALWVSTLPIGPLGDRVMRHATTHGVASQVERVAGARQGLYFLELATLPRSSTVIYDRARSAFALSPKPAVPWSEMLDADSLLVVSGITPALGEEVRRTVTEAISAAKSVGAVVAVDVNYRSALWSRAEAFAWLETAMDHIDVLAAGTNDLVRLGASEDDPCTTAIERLGLKAVLASSKSIDGRTAHISLTAGTADASHSISAAAEIVDPVGVGDAVFGTFLAGLGGLPLAEAVERAIGAAVSCYGTFGDALVTDPWMPDENGGIRR